LVTRAAIILSLILPFAFCVLNSHGAETVIVNKAFNGREIKVRVGGMIRVDLEELGSAGYNWELKDLDKDHFEVLSVETVQAPQKGDVVGAPVVRKWLISTKKEGKEDLKFLYYRPWEGAKSASNTFVLRVRII